MSNNPYALRGPLSSGTRPALDSGRLGVVTLYGPETDRRGPGRAWTARSLLLAAGQPVAAGMDGEAVRLDPPLQFAIVPRALRVWVPVKHR